MAYCDIHAKNACISALNTAGTWLRLGTIGDSAIGNYTILPRAFNKYANESFYVQNSLVDYLQSRLSKYRATPIVYVGNTAFGATIIYGFYKDFNIAIAYPTQSLCTMNLEGLT